MQSRAQSIGTEPPIPAGTLQGLSPLDVEHVSSYLAAVRSGGQIGWQYYFPYLLSLHRPGERTVLYTEDEGSACVFLWQVKDGRERLDLYLAPAPMRIAVLRRCLERVNDFNGDYSARVMQIDHKDADAVVSAGITVKPRKPQYLLAPDLYQDLGGKKFYTVRRNVMQIERLPNVEVVPYVPAHAGACHELLKQWKKTHRQRHGTYGGVGISRRAIELVGKLPEQVLQGEVVFIGSRLVAFAFGGEIAGGTGCFFERKCDDNIRGLSYFHMRSLLLRLRHFDQVNDSSDAGRPGLRQLKDSFRPIRMHEELRGNQRR